MMAFSKVSRKKVKPIDHLNGLKSWNINFNAFKSPSFIEIAVNANFLSNLKVEACSLSHES